MQDPQPDCSACPSSLFTDNATSSVAKLTAHLPDDWRTILSDVLTQPWFEQLARFVDEERNLHEVFPPAEDVFGALKYTPFEKVRVLLLGQDPYHDVGQAHGLCFSVRDGTKLPPSLANIFKELKSDLGVDRPPSGCLTHWAEQGVLLLNAVLTVRAHEANSHKDKGWELFTDVIIRKVNEKPDPVIFVLWGGYAQKKEKLIDVTRHTIIKSAHPSPLSANNGFLGSKPFSKINQTLRARGQAEIDWKVIL